MLQLARFAEKHRPSSRSYMGWLGEWCPFHCMLPLTLVFSQSLTWNKYTHRKKSDESQKSLAACLFQVCDSNWLGQHDSQTTNICIIRSQQCLCQERMTFSTWERSPVHAPIILSSYIAALRKGVWPLKHVGSYTWGFCDGTWRPRLKHISLLIFYV